MDPAVSIPAGTLVTLTATFTKIDGTLVDPTTVKIAYRHSRTAVVIEHTYPDAIITRESTGVYAFELDTTGTSGQWNGAIIGTGTCQRTQPFSFGVLALPVQVT